MSNRGDTRASTISVTVATGVVGSTKRGLQTDVCSKSHGWSWGEVRVMLCQRLNSPDICPAVKVISHGLLKHLFIIYLMELLDLRPSRNIFVHCGRHCTASAGVLPDYGSGLACHNIWLTKTLGEGGIVLSHTVNQCSTRVHTCRPV